MAARVRQPGQTERRGQPEKDSWNRTAKTGQEEKDRQNRTDTKGQPGLQGRTARIGQQGQDCQDRTARTGLPGTELPGQDYNIGLPRQVEVDRQNRLIILLLRKMC
jgi:hypothetical protein